MPMYLLRSVGHFSRIEASAPAQKRKKSAVDFIVRRKRYRCATCIIGTACQSNLLTINCGKNFDKHGTWLDRIPALTKNTRPTHCRINTKGHRSGAGRQKFQAGNITKYVGRPVLASVEMRWCMCLKINYLDWEIVLLKNV